jgi:hypothetical protein
MKTVQDIADVLKSYVYLYIDPRNNELFYVGKGTEDRLFAHLRDQSESKKVARIAEIRKNGYEPQIDVLRYGLSNSEAALVEAAVIDLIGKDNLTNKVSGYHSNSFGRLTSQELMLLVDAKQVQVKHNAILLTINSLYRSGMSPLELYETTRGCWRVGSRRSKVEYAFSLFRGIVLEVYRIDQWFPAGTLEYKTRDSSAFKKDSRWEFSGKIAEDIREGYVGFSVGKAGQNPIRYVIGN